MALLHHLTDEVHVWMVETSTLRNEKLLSAYDSLLSPEECQRFRRFKHEAGRLQFLVTRALVRYVLSEYLPVAPADWQFYSNPWGKPDILGVETDLGFNLSHCQGLVVCAVSPVKMVGVDVERLSRRPRFREIARRRFAPSEYHALAGLDEADGVQRFFDYWVLKEAYIKACGGGLSIPLNQFSFTLEESDQVEIRFSPKREDDPAAWQFWLSRPMTGYRLGLGLRDDGPFQLKYFLGTPLLGFAPHSPVSSFSPVAPFSPAQ